MRFTAFMHSTGSLVDEARPHDRRQPISGPQPSSRLFLTTRNAGGTIAMWFHQTATSGTARRRIVSMPVVVLMTSQGIP
jgi:hypothetical protein